MRSARSNGIKDPEYLAWIRTLPCICCQLLARIGSSRLKQESHTEAAHTGPRGLSQKTDDRTAIPLCGVRHHREGKRSHHRMGRKFFDYWGLDRDVLVASLNKRYDEQTRRGI